MRVWIICHLIVAFYWSSSTSAQDVLKPQVINPQESVVRNATEEQNGNPETDVAKKFFLPLIENENDPNYNFYPKPQLPHLFHPYIHHESDHYDHYDHHKPPEHEKPKPPIHKPHIPIHIHKPEIHKPIIHKPIHIHKPEIHKPPIVIHHKPVHKPVHIHIHKPSPHAFKPHISVHHGDHHKPDHHKPEHHKPEHHNDWKEDCEFNCTGANEDEGMETIEIPQVVLHEDGDMDEDDTRYSTDQSYIYSALEEPENFENYDVNYPVSFEKPSKPNSQNGENPPGVIGVRKPMVSLSDFLTEMRPVPWYSQHQEEKEPVRKQENPSNSGSDKFKPHNHDKDKPCQIHHHHHYHYVKHHEPHPYPYPHPWNPHPPKPYIPSYYPKAAEREDEISSTEPNVTETITVSPAVTIPLNEYDVSTRAATEALEEDSQKPAAGRKPKPKPGYRPISHMLLGFFTTPKPKAKAAKPQKTDHDATIENNDSEEDTLFPDFFELK